MSSIRKRHEVQLLCSFKQYRVEYRIQQGLQNPGREFDSLRPCQMRLKVSSRLGPIFDLEMVDSKLIYHFVKATVQKEVTDWVAHGVIEWVQDGPERYDCYPRVTAIDHPQFFSRLKQHLERQFTFTFELTEN